MLREDTGAESRAAGGRDGAEHGNERQVDIYYAVESGLHDVENLMVAKTGVFLRPADLSRWPSISPASFDKHEWPRAEHYIAERRFGVQCAMCRPTCCYELLSIQPLSV